MTDAPRPLAAGAIIGGRYRLEQRLGEGGMGTVWAAVHTVTLRHVALKFLRVEARSQHERFLREARAAAAVEHPHVVRVEDVFEAEDGTPTMVMERLTGESLQARLDRHGRLSVAETAATLLPVVSAVGAAHAAGVIHRDLKPDNIFIAQQADGTSCVKVLDFGIAKVTVVDDLAQRDLPGITRTGALLGTPFYMSPEQAVGEPVDHRADIWSLGIILYQLVSGVLPTRADTLGGVLRVVITGNLPPLRSQGLDLPEDVLSLVDRMLAHDVELRIHDLHEVQRVLEAHASVSVPTFGAPTAPREPDVSSPDLSTAAFVRQSDTLQMGDTVLAHDGGTTTGPVMHTPVESVHIPTSRAPRWIAGLVGVALVGGAGFALAPRDVSPTSEPTEADAPAVAPELEAPKLGLAALSHYRDPEDAKVGTYRAASAWDAVASDFQEAIKQPGAPLRWKSAYRFAAGMAAERRGQLEEALSAYDEAIDLEPKWPEPHAARAEALTLLGRNDEALKSAQRAERLDPQWWVAVTVTARVHSQTSNLDEAIETYQRARGMAPNKPRILAEMALVYHAKELDHEALRYAKRALAINPDLLSVRLMLAERALEKRETQEALAQAERAVGLAPKAPNARIIYGDALLLAGRRDEAAAAYDEALRLVEVHGGRTIPPARLQAVKKARDAGTLPPTRDQALLPHRSVKAKQARSVPGGGQGAGNASGAPNKPRTKPSPKPAPPPPPRQRTQSPSTDVF